MADEKTKIRLYLDNCAFNRPYDDLSLLKNYLDRSMNMKTDTLIRNEGMEILAKTLGLVEAERFIMLMQRESFDYTEWQRNLFNDMTVEELSKKAMEYRKSNIV
jgi:hypothetical protein